jgi:hypothetical protein
MRIDDPQLVGEITNALDQRIVGRVLLQTEVVVQGDADVRLVLPATPYNRFEVEIDDIAPTANDRILLCRFSVAGAIRSLADDYEFVVDAEHADGGDRYSDRTSSFIAMSSDGGNIRFGNYVDVDVDPPTPRIPMNTGSYHVRITPGNDTNTTPKVWFTGSYYSSEGINDRRIVSPVGSGIYKGWTTRVWGRAEEIQFLFNADTIDRGTFRLYGTE